MKVQIRFGEKEVVMGTIVPNADGTWHVEYATEEDGSGIVLLFPSKHDSERSIASVKVGGRLVELESAFAGREVLLDMAIAASKENKAE